MSVQGQYTVTTQHLHWLQNTYNVLYFYTLLSPLYSSNNIGTFDAVWDRGGLGSVAVKDRQRYVHSFLL